MLSRASLEMSQWRPSLADLQPGIRNRGLALQEGPVGTAQAPDFTVCLLGTARERKRTSTRWQRCGATKQALEIWKNADADFIPAQEAKREMAALKGSS